MLNCVNCLINSTGVACCIALLTTYVFVALVVAVALAVVAAVALVVVAAVAVAFVAHFIC